MDGGRAELCTQERTSKFIDATAKCEIHIRLVVSGIIWWCVGAGGSLEDVILFELIHINNIMMMEMNPSGRDDLFRLLRGRKIAHGCGIDDIFLCA